MSTNTPAQQVAAEIRAEMARQRRTGVDLARHLGVTQPTMSRRLNGDASFDLDDLFAIALWLDVPVSRLINIAATEVAS